MIAGDDDELKAGWQEREKELDALIQRIMDHHSRRELRSGQPRRIGDYDLGVMRGDMDAIMAQQGEQAKYQRDMTDILVKHTIKEEHDRAVQQKNDALQTASIDRLGAAIAGIEARMTVVDSLNSTLQGFTFMKKSWVFVVSIIGSLYAVWLFIKEYGTDVLNWMHIK